MSYFYVTEEDIEAQKQQMVDRLLNQDSRGNTLEWARSLEKPCPHCGKYPHEEKEP